MKTEDDLRRLQFELESKLRARLLEAGRAERPALYSTVYAELGEWLEEHGLIQGTDESSAALQLDMLRPLVDSQTTVVEFGGGDGALAARLGPLVGEMVVVDVGGGDKPQATGSPRRVAPNGLEVELEDGSADLVYSCHFVEHLHPEDLGMHLEEAKRLLRPGGAFVVVTPNRLWGPHDVSRDFLSRPGGLHLVEYSFGSLARRLREAGFRPVRAVRGFGTRQRLQPLSRYAVAESVLSVLTPRLRDWVVRLLAPQSRPPLRPLEQVKLHALR